MVEIDDPYEGRLQTKIKHFVLEKYLGIACRIIGRSKGWREFVYVDGFSGPWESKDANLTDTSFRIVLSTLRKVRSEIVKSGGNFTARCMFIEKKESSFEKLKAETEGVGEFHVCPIHGSFDEQIDEIRNFVGTDFSFIFIDPTGWKFIPLKTLTPLLELRGEVMINFMYRFITRVLTSDHKDHPEQARNIMGGDDWRSEFDALINDGESRENAVIEVYRRRVKRAGGHKFVKSFRVAHPEIDAPYFYLIYCTNHLLGLRKFSEVEEKAFALQSAEKLGRELVKREKATGTADLFDKPETRTLRTQEFEAKRKALTITRSHIERRLEEEKTALYESILGQAIERALVWERDVKDILSQLRDEGRLEFPDKPAARSRPNDGTVVVWLS